jgi:hypothetical protein
MTGLLGAEDGVEVVAERVSRCGARKSGEDDGVFHLDSDVFDTRCRRSV